jgi:hypothetical protein
MDEVRESDGKGERMFVRERERERERERKKGRERERKMWRVTKGKLEQIEQTDRNPL